MKGIILAGGTGSRLFPLTKVTNKHLLPVGRVPMIYHPLQKLLDAGIREILVVTGTEHMGAVVSLLGSGRELDCDITYRVQDEEKPARPKSAYAVCGVYIFDAAVFDIIRTLRPSGRGELEITDVNNAYIARGELQYELLAGWWTDAGTFDSLRRAQSLVESLAEGGDA
jgi:dTDP-glucose pyrophosphorylase